MLHMMSGGGGKSITFTFGGVGGQALLTETCWACEEGLVEVLVVDGHGLHQGWGEGQHVGLEQIEYQDSMNIYVV